MKELIKVSFDNCERPTVLGRDLHEFLEIETRYDKWIKRKINQYSFIEEIDYIALVHGWTTAQGNKTQTIEHQLTLDMAKQLSMLAEGNKGIEARKYFIRCEEIAKQKMQSLLPSYQIEDNIKRAEKWIEEQKEHEREIQKQKDDTLKVKLKLGGKSGGLTTAKRIWKRKAVKLEKENIILKNENISLKELIKEDK